MEQKHPCNGVHSPSQCARSIAAVQDTLYVIGGKWKLPIIVALSDGPLRFRQLLRQLGDITPKILSNELKQMELNEFVSRTVPADIPLAVEYSLTDYSHSLGAIIRELSEWGMKHRETIVERSRSRRLAAAAV